MVEGLRLEQWKQITWLRAGWTMKPADSAPLNAWNPLLTDSPGSAGGRVKTDADFNRAMGRALEKERAKHGE